MAKNGLGILLLLGIGIFFLQPSTPSTKVIAKGDAGLGIITNGGYAYQPVEQEYFREEVLTETTPSGRRRKKRILSNGSSDPVATLIGELSRESYQETVFSSLST